MIKSAIALAAAAPLMAAPALAGPYVNVETNAGWDGDDYTGATTDIHVGYEGELVLLPTTSKQVQQSSPMMVLRTPLASLVRQA